MKKWVNGEFIEMTPAEIAAFESAEQQPEQADEITMDDMIEIMAEQEYHICLLELGVNLDDL